MHRVLSVIVLFSILATSAVADINVVLAGSGSLDFDAINLGGNRYQLNIQVSIPSASGRVLTVTSDASDIIQICNIEAIGGTGSVVALNFAGTSPGAIESVEAVNIIPPPFGFTPASVSVGITLYSTAGSGRVGNASGTTTIEGRSFSTIICRELTADLKPPAGFDAGSITSINIAGAMTGSVEASNLTNLLVSGDIGASGNNVSISVADNLTTMTAKNIHANIDVGGNVQSIQVFGSGGTSIEATDAVFAGSLSCDTMNNGAGLRVWGDLEANVNIADRMVGPAARITVGRELAGDIIIGSGGMSRGITIGWMPSATGLWTGDITVAGQTLSPKGDYTQTGLAGGGAVGLAPYGLHKQACKPPYIGSAWPEVDVVDPGGDPITIDQVHYGFILHDLVAPAKPFEVTWATGNHCGSLCVHGDNIDDTDNWELHPTTPFPADLRTMRLIGTLHPNRHYHIIVDGTLRSWDAFPAGAAVATKPYVYIIYGN